MPAPATAPPGLFALERAPDEGGLDRLVVLVHGSMDRHASFARLRHELADLRTIVYDRRGYGRSRGLPVATRFDDHVEDLLALCGGRPAVVLGHSYGGAVALRAAQLAPEVAVGLVVFESPLSWLPGWPSDTAGARALTAPDPGAAAEVFLRRLLGDERWDDLPERAKADRRAEGPALVSDMRLLRPAPDRPPAIDLAQVRVPVVVGRGSRSSPHLQDGARRLVAALADATEVVVEGATHGAHASAPGALAAMVRTVLTRTT